MSQITTHILDTALGHPASGVEVLLQEVHENGWRTIGQGTTNTDGRITDLLAKDHRLLPGRYRLHFKTEGYFKVHDQACFYPEASVVFQINDQSHYHIPLLLSPFAYSTYRGS